MATLAPVPNSGYDPGQIRGYADMYDPGQIRGYSNISLWDKYKSNFSNAWTNKWGANTMNATLTGVFTALGTLASTYTPKRMYEYYERQEQAYIRTAMVQAQRAQLKGDILLSNLRTKHALEQGRNELAAAAGHGQNMAISLSGSTLDALAQNRRYQIKDERTTALNTLYEVENIKRQGYANAIGVAGQAMSTAYKSRNGALASIVSGVRAASNSLLADQRQYLDQDAQEKILRNNFIAGEERADSMIKGLIDLDTSTTITEKSPKPEFNINGKVGNFEQLYIGA